jgi:hypothetical protein
VLKKHILGGHGGNHVSAPKSPVVGQFGYGINGPPLPPAASELNFFGLVSAAAREYADMPLAIGKLDHLDRLVTYINADRVTLCAALQK